MQKASTALMIFPINRPEYKRNHSKYIANPMLATHAASAINSAMVDNALDIEAAFFFFTFLRRIICATSFTRYMRAHKTC